MKEKNVMLRLLSIDKNILRKEYPMFATLLILACNTTNDADDPYKEGRLVVDDDGDGFLSDEDCDDNNAQINPSVEEICDGIDNNCSGQVDEGVLDIFYADSDEDGYGNPNIEQSGELPDGYVSSIQIVTIHWQLYI